MLNTEKPMFNTYTFTVPNGLWQGARAAATGNVLGCTLRIAVPRATTPQAIFLHMQNSTPAQ